MTPLRTISVAVCVILVVGFLCRRRRRVHIPLMISALVIDVSMVVYLEVMRGVVESIPGRVMTPLLAFHILLSVVVLALYGVQVSSGLRGLRTRPSSMHARTGLALLVARFGNLFTSFLIV